MPIPPSMIVMITNTIQPYCYDIAHVLGLPTNFSHRFRYLAKYIKLSNDIKSIKGQDALIVLRNYETSDLIPVRYVNVEDVLTVGEINYIEFRMLDYFPRAMMQSASAIINGALEAKGFQNKRGEALECLVLELDGSLIGETVKKRIGNEHEKWGDILKEIGSLDCYKDYSFLKILHIRDIKEIPAAVSQDVTRKYSFVLEPGHLYFLDVIQHVPWAIERGESIKIPYDVELKAETGEVVTLRKIQRVVGKYDLLRFIFKTPIGYKQRHTFLEVEDKQDSQSIKHGLPALFLPIRVEPPKWMKWVRWCRIILGFLAIIAVVASEPIARIISIGPDWIRSIALLLLILSTGKWDEAVLAFIEETKEARLK